TLEHTLARTSATDRSHERAKVLYGAALLSWKEARPARGSEYAAEALATFREHGDLEWCGLAEWTLGSCRMAQGELVESRGYLEESLDVLRRAKHAWGEAQALAFLGLNIDLHGDYAGALPYFRDSIALLARLGDVIYGTVIRGVTAAEQSR